MLGLFQRSFTSGNQAPPPPPVVVVVTQPLAGGAYLGPARFRDRPKKRKTLEEQLRELLPEIVVKKNDVIEPKISPQEAEQIKGDLQTLAPEPIEPQLLKIAEEDDDDMLRVAAFMLL
jgi:hypothetical protein